MQRLLLLLLTLLLALLLLARSLFSLSAGQVGVLHDQHGLTQVIESAGLHWKSPLQRLSRLERRRQLLRSADALTLRTADAQQLRVHWALQWQLRDTRAVLSQLGGDRAAIDAALRQRVDAELQRELAGISLDGLSQRMRAGTLDASLRDALAAQLAASGVTVLDWRLTRFDVDPALRQTILAAMRTRWQRERVAELGRVRAELARAQAAPAVGSELAQARRQAQALRDQALVQVIAITDPVYRRDPAFARDYRKLLDARDVLARQGTVIVLDAGSPLLRPLQIRSRASDAR